MKKMKWILISLTGLLAVAGGGGWFALRSWMEKNTTPDSVVQRMEEEWNCRADVKAIDVSLFSNPARIEAVNLVMAPRDAEVGKPLAERKPAPGGQGGLQVRNSVLEVDTQDVIGGRLHVKKLVLSDVWVREEITPEGISVLQDMFRKALPTSAGPVVSPPLPAPVQPTISAVPSPEPEAAPPPPAIGRPIPPPAPAEPSRQTAKESNLPFGVVVDEAVLERVTFRIRNRQARTTTNLNELNLRISAVDIDPANLAQHNQCKIEISSKVDSSGRAKIGDETKDVMFANFMLRAHGVLKPYDEATRQFVPRGQMTLDLPKGGIFGGTQTIGQAAGKDKSFANLKDNFGIDVSDLIIGGALQEDVSADVNYENGRVRFLKDVRFAFPDYAVTLRQDSWVNAAADDHDMRLQLLPSEALAKKITDGVTAKMGDGVMKLALSIFSDGGGHLAFEIRSSERLSKPKFRLDGKAGALEQLFKGVGGDVLKGLIK